MLCSGRTAVNDVMNPAFRLLSPVAAITCLVSCTQVAEQPVAPRVLLAGPLISSRTTMVTAWEFPKNPLTDSSLDDSVLANEIRLGFRIFTNTRTEAARFTPGRMTCNNCHLNGGQREK